MEHDVEKAIIKLQDAIKLPHYYDAIDKVVTNIYEKGFKLSFHSDRTASSASLGVIKVGLNKKDYRSILWDVFHEFGHLLDPLDGNEEKAFNVFRQLIFKDKAFETTRELNAWGTADSIIEEYPELSEDKNDYGKYKDACLASYAFSFDTSIQNKMNEIITKLDLGRDYDPVIGKLIYLIYTHPNKCTIELFNSDEPSVYKVLSEESGRAFHQILLNINKPPKTVLWELLYVYGRLYINSDEHPIEHAGKRESEMSAWVFAIEEFKKHPILLEFHLKEFRDFKLARLADYDLTAIDYKKYLEHKDPSSEGK
jgi:hypothetical protein